MTNGSSICSGGVDGASATSSERVVRGELGKDDELVMLDSADARRVEFVASDDVVASSPVSTRSHVWSVASGANETRRLAGLISQATA